MAATTAAPPATSPATTSKIPTSTIQRAVTALLKWNSTKSQALKPQLLPSDDFLYLVVTLHKIPPKSRTNAFKLPLPHLLFHPNDAEICVIIDDKHTPSKEAKQKVLEEQIPISKVLKFSKLKTDYKPFEAKRKLCDSYDLFFADKRVVPLLPRLIGKHFYKKKKVPVPIELGRKNWKEQVERVCGSALMYLSTGTCSVIKVAKASMEEGDIVENIVAAVEAAVEVVPKKWGNIRSVHLKFKDSVALPMYQALPEMKMKIDSGIVVPREDNVSGGESESEKKGKGKKVGKKGRIHEVRYMDNVAGFGQMVGEDESGGEHEGEVIEGEGNEDVDLGIAAKKRKKGDGVKKAGKKGEKGLKQKKVKGLGKSVSEKKSKKSKVAA